MPSAVVIGGGLAGLATAAALGSAGFQVDLYEARGFLGGRATSFPVSPDDSELIDNCQHVLLRCCINLQDFYRRLGVAHRIRFHREFHFIEPGGRISRLRRGLLPAPLHLTGSFLRMQCLSMRDKIGIARGFAALRKERISREDLDEITMLDWLREKRQTPAAINRFWRQVLVSAVNEELDRMAAIHGFQVFWLGMMARADSYEMGVPDVPLRELYGTEAWSRMEGVRIHLRGGAERIEISGSKVDSVRTVSARAKADYYICCVPFERVNAIAPELEASIPGFEHSPITGIHLWFDRPVTRLPHATLLDRTIQWMFNKDSGRYIQFVVSASRGLVEMTRGEVIALALREGREFFPAMRDARLNRSQVVKELRATYSAKPGMEAARPPAVTSFPNLFLAGDWTRSGWPATMEGAVRSGYLAAEAVTAAAGHPAKFVLPDLG